MAIGANFIV